MRTYKSVCVFVICMGGFFQQGVNFRRKPKKFITTWLYIICISANICIYSFKFFLLFCFCCIYNVHQKDLYNLISFFYFKLIFVILQNALANSILYQKPELKHCFLIFLICKYKSDSDLVWQISSSQHNNF